MVTLCLPRVELNSANTWGIFSGIESISDTGIEIETTLPKMLMQVSVNRVEKISDVDKQKQKWEKTQPVQTFKV